MRPMGPCEKHPTSEAWKWTLVDGQCTALQVSVRCGSKEDPPGDFDTAADCDAANHVTTKLAVVTLMTASGEIARANASRNAPPSCSSVGFHAGSTCSAKDYGLVCASEATGTEYLACVLPLTSENSAEHYCDFPRSNVPYSYRCSSGPTGDGNACYGMCNTGRGSTTYLGIPWDGTQCTPFTLCGAPP